MSELELVRLHEDGERLVLHGPDGQSFMLPITEALRAAVRRDRASLEHWRASGTSTATPREIQSRLRAGATAQGVADDAGVPIEHVRRFEGPVVAEQEYVVSRLRTTPTHDAPPQERPSGRPVNVSVPTLEERIGERLAARGLDGHDVTWSAAREPKHPWVVSLQFTVGGSERTARWTFDPSSREQHALDDEALWLTQDDSSAPDIWEAPSGYDVSAAARPILAAVDAPPQPATDPTTVLLDDLHLRRGVRADARVRQDALEGTGRPQHPSSGRVQMPPVRTSTADDGADAGRPSPADEPAPSGARVLQLQRPSAASSQAAAADPPARTGGPGPADEGGVEQQDASESVPEPAHEESRPVGEGGAPAARPARTGKKQNRKGRAGVPSWDDILFGAKQD